MALSKANLETLIPEKSFVVFAQYEYRVAEINGHWIGIYDEEPTTKHIDYVQASSCDYTPRKL